MSQQGLPGGSVVKNLPAMPETQVRSLGWGDPLEKKWQPIPILLPGKSRGQRSLVSYSPWGCKRVIQLNNNKTTTMSQHRRLNRIFRNTNLKKEKKTPEQVDKRKANSKMKNLKSAISVIKKNK